MWRALSSLTRLVGRMRRDRRGVAAVEFALILPLMLTLYIGTLELSQIIIVDRRVTVVGGTVGDLVARSKGSINTATLNTYFQAANAIIAPYPTTNLKQVVSLISVSSTGVATVVWSQGYNGGTALTASAAYPLATTTEINRIARGSYLVASTVQYSYKALLGMVFSDTVNYSHTNYFVPRFGAAITKAD